MKRKTLMSIFLGVIVIVVGVVLCGNAMGIWDVNVFFPGWWTLFIIVPCLYWIFTSGPDMGNIIGLIVGVMLLLNNTEFFGPYISWKLILPVIIVVIGVNIIISAIRKSGTVSERDGVKFGERKIDYAGKDFTGGTFKCAFGEMKIDLTNAVIKQEKPFAVDCSFGDVTIYLPAGVSLDVKSETSFGKVNTIYSRQESGIPLDIKINCSFGEVTVK